MSELVARFFRWNNSKLVITENIITEKFFKTFFWLSVMVYRVLKPQLAGKSSYVTIHNFDGNLSLKIDKSRSMGAALYWTGFHEFREFLFLHRYLKPEMVFIDIGANLGEYSLFAAKRLSGGKVFAFEPLPSIRSVLEQNINLNGFKNIEVFPFGLSSQEETMVIHEFEDVHEGLATLFPGGRQSRAVIAVELKKLDDVISLYKTNRIDFIKVDIEGAELKALQGCRSLIKIYSPVFMVEINEETYKAAGYVVDDVLDFFIKVNYQPYQIKKRGFIKKCEVLPAFGNILFIPQ